jgi:hypothetical protein
LTTGLLAVVSFAFAKSHAKGAIKTAKCKTAGTGTSHCYVTKAHQYTLGAKTGACFANGGRAGTLRTITNCAVALTVLDGE